MAQEISQHRDILHLIAQLLEVRDCLTCLRVSKTFQSVFETRVWEVVDVDRLKQYYWVSPTSEIFERHAHLIRELELGTRVRFNFDDTIGPKELLRQPVLKASFVPAPVGHALRCLQRSIFRFLWSGPGLLRSIYIKSYSIPRSWITALLRCENLQELTLRGMDVPEEDVHLFLELCSRPRRLDLSCVNLHALPLPGTLKSSFSNVHHLRIGPAGMSGEENVEQLIVRYFVHLRCLEYNDPDIYSPESGMIEKRHIEKLLLDIPKFTQLNSLDVTHLLMDDNDLGPILENLNGLRVLEMGLGECGVRCMTALTSTRERNGSVWRLCDKLETLNLSCVEISTAWFSPIMEHSPLLRIFKTAVVHTSDILAGGLWVCVNLTELDITVEADIDPSSEQGNGQLATTISKISQLKELTCLTIEGRTGRSANMALNLDTLRFPSLLPLRNLRNLENLKIESVWESLNHTNDDFTEAVRSWEKLRILRWVRKYRVPPGCFERVGVNLPQSAIDILKLRKVQRHDDYFW